VRANRRARRPRAAFAAAAVALVLLGLASTAAAAPPWQAADTIRADLFEAQTQLLLGKQPAGSAVGRAQRAVDGPLERGLAADAPGALGELHSALAAARSAYGADDQVALAAARGRAIAALRRGAFAVAVAATERGAPAQARAWLLVRDFRQSTRFTRPGVDATAALLSLQAGDASPRDAAVAVRKDLLDAYQSRLKTNLDDADQAAERSFDPQLAEAAALAAGYWQIVAPEYRSARGPADARRVDADFAALAAAAAATDLARFARLRQRVAADLDGFTAAPFTPEEQSRRAHQLTRFLDLVPVEYGRGAKDGHVTAAFEIQEAKAFHDGVDQAFGDLEQTLAETDPAAVRAIERDIAQLGQYVDDANERTAVADVSALDSVHDRISDRLDRLYPDEWKESSDEADFDLVEISLGQMIAAANAREKAQAEQARLAAYAFFEFGPEPKLRAFDPGLALDVEGLFWYGARDHKGLATLISSGAPIEQVRESKLALDGALDEARAKTGEGASTTTTIVNAALIVFREGLEAILIIAAITASMLGARAVLRRPIYRGALLALPVSLLAYALTVALLGSLQRYGEQVEALVGILAVAVLLVVLNWFFHKVYWTEWIAGHRKRGKELTGAVAVGAGAGAATVAGLYFLGFTSVFREGMETVLFLQTLQLASGTGVVLAGVALGLVGTAIVGLITFRLEQRLPYKRMLVVTGVLITFILFEITGNTARSMQGVGWLPVHTLNIDFPLWMGTWLGVYPTVETLGAQLLAVAFVIGSYYAAEYYRKNRARRPAPKAAGQAPRGSGEVSPQGASAQATRAASSAAIAAEATARPNGSPGNGRTAAPASDAIKAPADQSHALSPRS
jgi:high-affinity iron transporter